MLPLGTQAPSFSLLGVDGTTISLDHFSGDKALVVVFLCNHCPYVKHIAPELAKLSSEYMAKEVGFVGINSNDTEKYPEDSLEKMVEEAQMRGYEFPYLLDADQSVAQAYHAACTPDIFVFDADRRLVYRGQIDDSRPKNDKPLNGADLRAALDAILDGRPIPEPQKPSIGCNIKWKEGNEPDYFNPVGVA
jgi:peroxiredoxin